MHNELNYMMDFLLEGNCDGNIYLHNFLFRPFPSPRLHQYVFAEAITTAILSGTNSGVWPERSNQNEGVKLLFKLIIPHRLPFVEMPNGKHCTLVDEEIKTMDACSERVSHTAQTLHVFELFSCT